jgi:cupin 2 domain-containing protein
MPMGNIFSEIPHDLPDELFEDIVVTGDVKIERILSEAHSSRPGFWYDQEKNEWVILLRGSAKLSFEDAEETIILKPGDWLNIPAHRKHRVEWTDPNEKTIWLAVHY